MRWSGTGTLLVSDEGNRYTICRRRGADGDAEPAARIVSLLVAPLLRGPARPANRQSLIVGRRASSQSLPWVDRIAARTRQPGARRSARRRHVVRHIACLQRRFSGTPRPGDSLGTSHSASRSSLLSRSHRARAHVLSGNPAGERMHSVWRRCRVLHGGYAGPRAPRPRRGLHRGRLEVAFRSGLLILYVARSRAAGDSTAVRITAAVNASDALESDSALVTNWPHDHQCNLSPSSPTARPSACIS